MGGKLREEERRKVREKDNERLKVEVGFTAMHGRIGINLFKISKPTEFDTNFSLVRKKSGNDDQNSFISMLIVT